MTAMPPLRDILNDTPVDAVDVDYNFGVLESHMNNEVINRDGSVAMTGDLSLARPPTAPQHATTKAYVDGNVIPIGTIWEYAGITPPAGWAFCDGSSKSTTDPAFVALFEVIGYRHGGAGGNFNLPDRRARVPIGYSAGDAVAGTLGAKGGRRDAVLVGHDHTTEAHSHGGSTANQENTNHYHAMRSHVHGMAHNHDSNVRNGYDIIGSTRAGLTNAVFPAQGNAVLELGPLRPTALCQQQVGGTGNQQTSGVQGRGDINNTDGPNDNNTNWLHETPGQSYMHGHALTIQPNSPKTDSRGETPTNLNYPLYEVVNYMIRIG